MNYLKFDIHVDEKTMKKIRMMENKSNQIVKMVKNNHVVQKNMPIDQFNIQMTMPP